MIIYKATFPNNKCYIGCTKDSLDKRKRNHKHFALKRNSQTPFARSIRKYGWENIIWEVIYETKYHDDLLEKEKYFIELLKPQYNLTKGGEGTLGLEPWNKGKQFSEKSKLKMRQSHASEGKSIVIINENTKKISYFSSIADGCRQLNLPYSQIKTALKRKQTYFEYKIVLQKDYHV